MKILVLDANYPHDDNLHGDVFVHVRVKSYIARGHSVRVLSFFTDRADYEFEGVEVHCAADLARLNRLIAEFDADVIAIHFFQGWMLAKLIETHGIPTVVWVHGVEALGWYRRLFNFELSRRFADYVKYNVIQMVRLRKLFRHASSSRGKIRFVFVSDWMRRIAEADTLTRASFYDIIPNPIDVDRFPYVEKDASLRRRVLLIRSFDSRKYANDIAVAGILELSKLPEFEEFTFAIHGRGYLFDKLTRPLRNFANVHIHEGFLNHAEIRRLHAANGVLLCPTRQDAQGVSMCEGMSSGLVPITSRSTAIPEFVEDGVTGFLTDGARGMAEALRLLNGAPDQFERMSRNAAADIRRRCGIEHIVDHEIHALDQAITAAA